MEKKMEQEKLGERASVPAFGEWDKMKAAGVLPDYSLDFSKIRAVRMQRKKAPSWSSAGSTQELTGGERQDHKQQSARGDGRDRRHHHRRQHSDGTDIRRPLRPDRAAPKGRSNFKGCLFGCMGGW